MGLNLDSIKNMQKPEFNDGQKKLIKIGVIAIVALVAVILVVVIFSAIVGSKVSDQQLQNIMIKAAKQYIEDNPDKMPDEIFGVHEITLSNLVTGGYMKEITKLKGKDTSCTGSVFTYFNNGNYSYSVKLKNCDSEDDSITLADKIKEEDNIVEQGNGLYYYPERNVYVYRGEYVDNYINFAGQLWRIMRIDENGNIRMIQDESGMLGQWDNRYNVDRKANIGINYFEGTESSRIKDSIISYYNDEENFSSLDKSVMIPTEYCVGSRADVDYDKTGVIECTTKSELMGIGGPNVSELLEISLDVNCNSTLSNSCANYNYLAHLKTKGFWTLTPTSANTYQAYAINTGLIASSNASTVKKISVVAVINGNVKYKEGTGTIDKPYQIEIIG